MSSVEEEVLQQIRERTEPEPDGVQNAHGNLWTSRERLRSDAVKPGTGYDKESLKDAIDSLEADGEVIAWFGLLAPATEGYLSAIIQNEAEHADITRPLLVGQCNRLRGDSA